MLAAALLHSAGAAPRQSGRTALAQAGEQYFIEFRARPSALGHAYIVYGHLDATGQPTEIHYAGNQPSGGDAGAVLGAFVPVPGRIRAVPEDFKLRPTAVYHRRLTPTQYAHLKIAVARVRAREHTWHLFLYNCNDFAVEIAHSIGLISPPMPWLPPDVMVNGLRALNGP